MIELAVGMKRSTLESFYKELGTALGKKRGSTEVVVSAAGSGEGALTIYEIGDGIERPGAPAGTIFVEVDETPRPPAPEHEDS